MLTFQVTEDDVFSLMPLGIKRPAYVTETSKAGVTKATYDSFELRYNAYINSQLRKEGIPIVTYSQYSAIPSLLVGAQANLVAAAIQRIFDNPQNPYKDLYATGNILLRAYIEEYQIMNGISVLGSPEFVTDDTVDLTQYSFNNLV